MLNTNETLLKLYVIFLAVVGIFTGEIHLPAFAQLRSTFGTTEVYVGLTVSVYMFGFAIGQLIYGPLSDMLGRKPVLTVGMAIFALSSIGCMFVSNIEQLLVLRFIQAFGASAAYVIWQPIVIDSFSSDKVQKVFATTVALLGVSPALAPLIGGFLASSIGWKSIFVLLCIISVAIFLITAIFFKESNKNIENHASTFDLTSGYMTLIRDGVFWGLSLAVAFNVAVYMVYITLIPFVLAELGWAPEQIGMIFLPVAISFMFGSMVSKRVVAISGELAAVCTGASLSLLSCVVVLIIIVNGLAISGYELAVAFLFVAFFNGFVLPNTMSVLMQRHSCIAGTCASGMGFLMSILTVITTAIGVYFAEFYGAQVVLGVELVIAALISLMVFVVSSRKLKNDEDNDKTGAIECEVAG